MYQVWSVTMINTKHSCCSSLNRRSKVRYCIDVSEGETYISIIGTSGNANTTEDRVVLSEIERNLYYKKNFVSTDLYTLLPRNNAGFVVAVLLNEGIIEKDGKRYKLLSNTN